MNHPDRREFIGTLALATAGSAVFPGRLPAARTSAAAAPQPPAEIGQPSCSFIFACDAHLGIPGDTRKPAALRRLMAELNARRFDPLPDFVMMGGDNVNGGQSERWDQAKLPGPIHTLNQQRELAAILAELRPEIALRMIPHTHDIKEWRYYDPKPGRITSDHGRSYRTAFGEGAWTGTVGQPEHAKTHFYWTIGNTLFAAFGNDGEVTDYSEESIQWLDEVLGRKEFAGHVKIAFGHVPAVYETLPDTSGTRSLRSVLLRHRVRVLFSGHSHVVAAFWFDGAQVERLVDDTLDLSKRTGFLQIHGGSLGYAGGEFAHVSLVADRLIYQRHAIEESPVGWRNEEQKGTPPERNLMLLGMASA